MRIYKLVELLEDNCFCYNEDTFEFYQGNFKWYDNQIIQFVVNRYSFTPRYIYDLFDGNAEFVSMLLSNERYD